MIVDRLTPRQRQVLETVEEFTTTHGYPPSVREIGKILGLKSPSSVHSHLSSLERLGYIRRDEAKTRAIVLLESGDSSDEFDERPMRRVPLVGDVAAGTDVLAEQNIEELIPVPTDFTGEGELFMLRVRGDSMIDAGILDGDYVVVRSESTVNNGDIVVTGIPGEEATVKTWTTRNGRVFLLPANAQLSPMEFDPSEVRVFGRVVTVMRRL
ncbi:MAG: transcriptional repressor LexA [Acidimicrobiia bacterium]